MVMDLPPCNCQSSNCEFKAMVKSKERLLEQIDSLLNSLYSCRMENSSYLDVNAKNMKEIGNLKEKLKNSEEIHESLLAQMKTAKETEERNVQAKDIEIKKLLKRVECETMMKTMRIRSLQCAVDQKSAEIVKLTEGLKLLEAKRVENEKHLSTTLCDLQRLNNEKDKTILELRHELEEKRSRKSESMIFAFSSERHSNGLLS